MLLCIEMAMFSIFHLWAFPWTVYDINRSNIVASESAPGFLPDPKTAYQGGKFGEQALMEAFNPWDLIKAVGRGFRWAAVGRRRRMEDISYKTSQGVGLEPTRNQFTAFDSMNGGGVDDQHGTAYYNDPSPPKHLDANEDKHRLLANAQSNPTSDFPRPMSRHPPRDPALGLSNTGDIGTAKTSVPYSPSPYADSHGQLTPTITTTTTNEYGIATPESSSLGVSDTGYHPPRSPAHSRNVSGESSIHSHRKNRSVTPTTIPPDAMPLGPPGRKSSEHAEWEMYGGRGQGEDERALGGGHGVGDNRF